MKTVSDQQLMEQAIRARANAYTPYSGFRVGAALLCADGQVYTGCNIENAAYGPSVCAERVAIFSAVAAGQRAFAALALAGGKGEAPQYGCTPCGVCRQVLQEFCSPDLPVLLYTAEGIRRVSLAELLPYGFGSANLEG